LSDSLAGGNAVRGVPYRLKGALLTLVGGESHPALRPASSLFQPSLILRHRIDRGLNLSAPVLVAAQGALIKLINDQDCLIRLKALVGQGISGGLIK
jgi:hypothetical protein